MKSVTGLLALAWAAITGRRAGSRNETPASADAKRMADPVAYRGQLDDLLAVLFGRRFSPLKQIDKSNVAGLGLA